MRSSAETVAGEATGARTLSHLGALDGLRGVAVLLIVVYHVSQTFLATPITWLEGGFLGVDVFFVLSGFLITALLLGEQERRGAIRFGQFFRRRGLRLVPAIVAFAVVHAAYAAAVGISGKTERESLGLVLTYLANWQYTLSTRATPEGMAHLWSLAVEGQFYLVWPFVVALLLAARRPTAFVVGVLVVAIVGVSLWRAHLYDHGTLFLYLYLRTDTRVDGLLVGALVAQLWSRLRFGPRVLAALPAIGAAGAAAIVASIGLAKVSSPFLYRGGYTLVALGGGALVLALVSTRSPLNRVLELAPLRAVGKVSYGLYLWHAFVFVAVERWGRDWSTPAKVVVGLAGTAAATLLSWHLVEKPFLQRKDRSRHSADRPTVTVATAP